MLPGVEYLGYIISADGIQSSAEKVHALMEAPRPENTTQLRSFLGLLNFYNKFLPQSSTWLAPLHQLLKQNAKWAWGKEQDLAFKKAQEALLFSDVLVHYNQDLPLILECDASPYGVGAVLSHEMEDGSTKPVSFASRSLTPTEKRYAHLDKEALAIIFGVKRFHLYLAGRKFSIVSDHRPLQYLFAETKPVPAMASARIQRWALTLSAYDYTIRYKPGPQNANADLFSRLPLPETPAEVPLPGETILLLENLATSPVTVSQIRTATSRDPMLSRVAQLVSSEWNDQDNSITPTFQRKKNELSIHDGCLLWGSRVVVPQVLRPQVLDELHESHPGVSRMKAIARGVVWWPEMDSEIESKVNSCRECQLNQKTPAQAPLHPWEWPSQPWTRLHIDYAGPFLGKMFLVVVDAHSKWLEVEMVPTTSSRHTIEKLRSMFAMHGLPELLVSDNASVFTSAEFKEFLKRNGIRHATSAPYHPSSNGLAERYVQTFKVAMKKSSAEDIQQQLSRFLFHYRTTPHTVTGVSPAELLLGRRLRTHLDLMRPSVASRVARAQDRQKADHDRSSRDRKFEPGSLVFVKNFTAGPNWLPGCIRSLRGPLSFEVELDDGRVVKRHVDHVRSRRRAPSMDEPSNGDMDDVPLPWPPESTEPVDASSSESSHSTTPRRSTRTRGPPDRYTP